MSALSNDVHELFEAPRADALLDLSILIPARNAASVLEATCEAVVSRFARSGRSFEVLVLCNRSRYGSRETHRVATRLAECYPVVGMVDLSGPPGKGRALSAGVSMARGRTIAFTDADLPFGDAALERAIRLTETGADLVCANRRDATCRLEDCDRQDPPVGLVNRERLGMAFNALVQRVLPITTCDSQAGLKAMTRSFARAAFGSLCCPGFLFDLELLLYASANGSSVVEIPVRLRKSDAPSTVSITRELFHVASWLPLIVLRHQAGFYRRNRVVLLPSGIPKAEEP